MKLATQARWGHKETGPAVPIQRPLTGPLQKVTWKTGKESIGNSTMSTLK